MSWRKREGRKGEIAMGERYDEMEGRRDREIEGSPSATVVQDKISW